MIEHEGIIHNINGNQLTICITQNSACSDCHAKGACMAADTKEKMVNVLDNSGQFKLHERVMLMGKTSIGYKAVLWAFVIPLIVLVGVIIAATSVWHVGELHAALLALATLVPYYLILYLLRHKMSEKLAFTIKKIN